MVGNHGGHPESSVRSGKVTIFENYLRSGIQRYEISKLLYCLYKKEKKRTRRSVRREKEKPLDKTNCCVQANRRPARGSGSVVFLCLKKNIRNQKTSGDAGCSKCVIYHNHNTNIIIVN